MPSAFTYTTGQAHWELLLRARAVENQCVVLAPAQGGTHENGRRTWGHSMIVDPWGEVLALQAEGEGVVLADGGFAAPRCRAHPVAGAASPTRLAGPGYPRWAGAVDVPLKLGTIGDQAHGHKTFICTCRF